MLVSAPYDESTNFVCSSVSEAPSFIFLTQQGWFSQTLRKQYR